MLCPCEANCCHISAHWMHLQQCIICMYIDYCTHPSPLLDASTKSIYMQVEVKLYAVLRVEALNLCTFSIVSTAAMLLTSYHKLMQDRMLFCCLEQLILALTLPMWPSQGPWILRMWMMWSWITRCTCTLDTAQVTSLRLILPRPAYGPAEVQSNLIAIEMVKIPFNLSCCYVHWLLYVDCCEVYLVCVAGAYAACRLHCE